MRTRAVRLAIQAFAAAAALASAALAHDAGMAMDMAGYGGQMAVAGGYHIEFIVRDGGIRAWVSDARGRPRPAAGTARVLAGGVWREVPLKAGPTMLAGAVPVKAADAVECLLSLVVDGRPVAARFAQAALVTPRLTAPEAAGRQAFQAACAQCHGLALRGTDNGPPLLHPMYAPGGDHDDSVILAAMHNGVPRHMWRFGDMPRPDLPPGSAPAVLAYIRAMQAANGLGGPAPGPMAHGG